MKEVYYGWWIVLASFLVAFYVAGTTFYGFTAFIEPLTNEFGWSYSQISIAASIRGLEMGLLSPFVGILADRLGPRKLLVSGAIVLGSGLILLGLIQSLPMYYGAFILIAFGAGGCTSVVTMTAIANWFDKNVGKAMGITSSGFGAGGLLIPFIIAMIAAFGWRITLIMLGIGVWVIVIPAALVIRQKVSLDSEESTKPPAEIAIHPCSRQTAVRKFQYKDLMKTKSFLLINFAEFIRMMVLMAVVTHIMPYLEALDVSRQNAGLIAAAVPVLSIIGRLGFGWLGDLFETKYVIALSYSIMGLGMLALCYADLITMIYLFLFFFSIGLGGVAVLRGAFLRELYGKYNFGKLLGIMMGFGACGGLIGPTMAGYVFDQTGSYFSIWLAFSAIIVLSIFFVMRIESKVKDLGGN
jgi:MFS family permease